MSAGCRIRLAVPGLLLALLAGLPLAALADDLRPPGGGFGLPLDCRMGEVCTIQNYIDHDPGPGATDYACGPMTYNGHRGIDFRIPTQIEMRQGIAVIAAADGNVIEAHDGEPDLLMADTGRATNLNGRNGNWVAIDHGDTWVTTYAHMRQGSVAVRRGDRVKRGQMLGFVGLSGNSDFPHVHFAVTHDNRLLDPFTGGGPDTACGTPGTGLWSPGAQAQLTYRTGGLLSAGFLDRQPSYREVMAGIAPKAHLSPEADKLIFWVGTWGLFPGDRQHLTVLAPDGEIFVTTTHPVEKYQAVGYRLVGRKRHDRPWPEGRYRGIYRVERKFGGTSVTVVETIRDVTIP